MRINSPLTLVAAFALAAFACTPAGPVANTAQAAKSANPPGPPSPIPANAASTEGLDVQADAAYALGETEDEIEDGAEPHTVIQGRVAKHPLDGRSDADVAKSIAEDPTSLGSLSLGQPGAGRLIAGVTMPETPGLEIVDPAHCWGTQETIEYLRRAVSVVREQFPAAHPLYLGHISAKHGGPLRPHKSHQSGRDVDISYYYLGNAARWYARANQRNLDVEKTWAFVRALIEHTDVNLILIDYGLQRLLRKHAEHIGEDPGWLDSVFRGVPGKLRPLIVHAKGHATHMHIRFFNPIAQESARRAYATLIQLGLAEPPVKFTFHRVKRGETLGMLARKYRTTVTEIRKANGLRSTKIIAKKRYRIPKRVALRNVPRVAIPERRKPPRAAAKTPAKALSGS